jgi:AbrB family looped-hinge helix DNA binding protein
MHDKRLFGTATVGTKGQVVIPADAREAFDIKSGDRLYVIGSSKAGWIGLLKEDQLRAMIEHLTDNIDQFRTVIENADK